MIEAARQKHTPVRHAMEHYKPQMGRLFENLRAHHLERHWHSQFTLPDPVRRIERDDDLVLHWPVTRGKGTCDPQSRSWQVTYRYRAGPVPPTTITQIHEGSPTCNRTRVGVPPSSKLAPEVSMYDEPGPDRVLVKRIAGFSVTVIRGYEKIYSATNIRVYLQCRELRSLPILDLDDLLVPCLGTYLFILSGRN